MSNILHELLYEYVKKSMESGEDINSILSQPVAIWDSFIRSAFLNKNIIEIKHSIVAIAKEIDRKDKLRCQYCRIDEGFLVQPPVKAEELCKKHRQEYEEYHNDRTLTQKHPGIGEFIGEEGLHCSAPPRER